MVTTEARVLEPRVARRLLRYELHRLCAGRGVTHAKMGARLGVSRASFSQLVAGKSLPSRAVLEVIVHYLGAAERLPRLLELLACARQVTSCQTNDRDLLVGLETYADAIEVYDPLVITPLLRTTAYAAALSACGVSTGRALDASDGPPSLVWLVEEHVLRRRVGDEAVMVEQYDHLRRLAASPHVTVHVLPVSRGAHTGLGGGFEVVHGNGGSVAFEHTRHATQYHDQPETVAAYAAEFSALRRLALTPDESEAMLATF